MQPEVPTTTFSFEEFAAKKKAANPPADLTAQLKQSIERVKTKRGRPAAEPAAPATLADVLKQAVALAASRRANPAREVAVREQVLLEVLADVMRRDA